MGKLVLLKIAGDIEQGFTVTLQIAEDGYFPFTEITGRLPPAPEIHQQYKSWQSAYNTVGLGIRRLEVRFQQVSNFSSADIKEKAQILSQNLNAWLNSELFRPIKEKLLVNLVPSDEFRMIIQSEDPRLLQLPWHLWDFFEIYSKAEVAFSTNQYERVERATKTIFRQRVRILAILGNAEGIDLQKEEEVLKKLPNCEIMFLLEPQRSELNRCLWDEKGWDFLFFAGHSSSHNNFEKNQFFINKIDSLTIEDLKYALKKAIKHGLQLALFNSCDGLGLACKLEELNIPQVIVMRELVPDIVAQEFLKGFLVAFSSGKSLYASVREAREQLQGLEDRFPCASWLPVISQNPAEVPPTWQDFQRSAKANYPTINALAKNKLLFASAASLFFAAGVCSQAVISSLRLHQLLYTKSCYTYVNISEKISDKPVNTRSLCPK